MERSIGATFSFHVLCGTTTIKETLSLLLAACHIVVFAVMHLMTYPCVLNCHDLSKVAELEPLHGARLSQRSTSSPAATTGWMPDPAEKTNMMQTRRSWPQLLPFLLSLIDSKFVSLYLCPSQISLRQTRLSNRAHGRRCQQERGVYLPGIHGR